MRSISVALASLVSMAVAVPQNFGLQGLDLGKAFNNDFGLKGEGSFGIGDFYGINGQQEKIKENLNNDFGLKDVDSFGLGDISKKIEESKKNNFEAFGAGDFYGPTEQNLLKDLQKPKSLNFGKGSDFGLKNGVSFGFGN